MRRILKFGSFGLLGAGLLVYAVDWAGVTFRTPAYAVIRVDQLYTDTNRWHQIEWSRGDPVMERCIYSLFPQQGLRPCWYVTRHTTRVTNTD